ncbi:hypothetical protein WM2015_1680 [Wenzhouxiangella marina]|uniref:Sel1 repeat family protein n=2 Tax=Wenzhouxiangella marina TaxID=1579979 RepID=A0A0K0XWK3_9GAMM|nr:hypothetical protein WM2015_1680 [Wenzhouxiangella marina]
MQVPEQEAYLGQLFEQELNADDCRRHRPAIEHYLARMPVDLGYWETARDCAVLMGDVSWARQSRERIATLAAFAFREGRGQHAWNPAPVLHAWDIPTLAEARGLRLKWMRYLSLDSVRHLLVEASVVDQRGAEARYYFDLLEALLRLNADDPSLIYPGNRRALVFGQLEADALNGDPLALTGYLNIDPETGEINPVAARRALENAWSAGMPGAGLSLLELCLGQPAAQCERELMDWVIQGLIELEIAEGYALRAAMAIAFDGAALESEKVQADLRGAASLSESARMEYYLASVLDGPPEVLGADRSAVVDALIDRAAEAGEKNAMLLSVLKRADDVDDQRSAELMEELEHVSEGGPPQALHLLAMLHGPISDRGRRLLHRAAEQGVAQSQFMLGLLASIEASSKGSGDAEMWLQRAAQGGHTAAMRLLAQRALTGGSGEVDHEAAIAWLYSAWLFEDLDSALWLVALYAIDPDLNPEVDRPGLELARSLIEDVGPELVDSLATVLFEIEPFLARPERGLALLEALSADGLAEASLAIAYQRSDHSEEEARAWFRTAIEQGSVEARYQLSLLLFDDPGGVSEAVEQLQLAVEAGHDWASNNLAYLWCTGERGAAMNPQAGLAVVEALFERVEEPHPYHFSTLAACQAMAGRFEQAVENQEVALAGVEKNEYETSSVKSQMRERLALYRAGRPYRWEEGVAP